MRARHPSSDKGHCLRVLPTLQAEAVDVMVTSSPYYIGVWYRGHDDRRAEDDYLGWLIQIAGEIRRAMKAAGSFLLDGSSSALWLPFQLIVRLRSLFVLQYHIVWIKSIAIKDDAVGHFKPVGGGQRLSHRNHEPLLHLTLAGDVKLDRLAIGVARRGRAKARRCRGNAWFMPHDLAQSNAATCRHPSTLPVALPRWCIRRHGRQDTLVLDPFIGTGTMVVAAGHVQQPLVDV